MSTALLDPPLVFRTIKPMRRPADTIQDDPVDVAYDEDTGQWDCGNYRTWWDLQPLLDYAQRVHGLGQTGVRTRLGKNHGEWQAILNGPGLKEADCDKWACERFDTHPCFIWNDWYDYCPPPAEPEIPGQQQLGTAA